MRLLIAVVLLCFAVAVIGCRTIGGAGGSGYGGGEYHPELLRASTYTPSLSLAKPAYGDPNWHVPLNANFDALDLNIADCANVKSYGAVGDNVTDDTAAFQDAIDSGKPAYVPYSATSYRLSSAILDIGANEILYSDCRVTLSIIKGITMGTNSQLIMPNGDINTVAGDDGIDAIYLDDANGVRIVLRGMTGKCVSPWGAGLQDGLKIDKTVHSFFSIGVIQQYQHGVYIDTTGGGDYVNANRFELLWIGGCEYGIYWDGTGANNYIESYIESGAGSTGLYYNGQHRDYWRLHFDNIDTPTDNAAVGNQDLGIAYLSYGGASPTALPADVEGIIFTEDYLRTPGRHYDTTALFRDESGGASYIDIEEGAANQGAKIYFSNNAGTARYALGLTTIADNWDLYNWIDTGTTFRVQGKAMQFFGRVVQFQVTIADGDTTPDVSGGNIFTTSSNTAPTAISDLDSPTPGQVIYIIGGSNNNSSTIADAGNFNLSAGWTASLDDILILYVQADNDYIELGRVNN